MHHSNVVERTVVHIRADVLMESLIAVKRV